MPRVAHLTTLFRSPSLRVHDVRCASPRSGPSAERGGESTHLALLRRGVFTYHLGSRAFVGDPNTALLHRGAWSYRVSHPGHSGDEVTVVELSPGLADELFGAAPRVTWAIPAGVQLFHQRVLRAVRVAPVEALDAEERVLDLLDALVHGARSPTPSLRPRDRRLVDDARARLGADLELNLPLTSLAREAGASPFHLMRVFRAATGLAVRAYRRQLRVLAALSAIAGGERDLAALAVRLGFSHHSHLSDSFRAVLGVTPTHLRREAAVPEARRFLEARDGARG